MTVFHSGRPSTIYVGICDIFSNLYHFEIKKWIVVERNSEFPSLKKAPKTLKRKLFRWKYPHKFLKMFGSLNWIKSGMILFRKLNLFSIRKQIREIFKTQIIISWSFREERYKFRHCVLLKWKQTLSPEYQKLINVLRQQSVLRPESSVKNCICSRMVRYEACYTLNNSIWIKGTVLRVHT